MACNDINIMMTALLDGELTHKEQGLVKTHLSTCQHCKREMEALASVQDDIRNAFRSEASQYSPSPLVWQKIKYQIMPRKQAASPIKRLEGIRLFHRKISWKTGLIGILALAIVGSLVVAIPPLFKQVDKALAAEIALNSTQVQEVLDGEEPSEVIVTGIIDDEGTVRVIMRVGPDMWVVADVDMSNQEVISVKVQQPSTITEQDVIDIATTDSRVQELFDKGYHIEDLEFVEVYSSIVDVWREEHSYLAEVNPVDLIGLTAGFYLQLGDTHGPPNSRYVVLVNVTTGKLVALIEPGQGPEVTIITSVETD